MMHAGQVDRDYQGAQVANPWPSDGLESVTACPVCRQQARTALYTQQRDRVFSAPGTWTLHECKGCGSAYSDPRPDQASIGLAYETYFTHAAPTHTSLKPRPIPLAKIRFALRNGYLNSAHGYRLTPALRFDFLLAALFPFRRVREDRAVRNLRFSPHACRLLDVGCGNGDFLMQASSLGWDVQGIEPDPQAVATAQRMGLSVVQGQLKQHTYPGDHFDVVTLGHVIEHLHDPVETLRQCYDILRPGGMIWIATPNLAAPGHKLFGEHWLGLDPPRHLVLFTPHSLRYALEQAGFTVSADSFKPSLRAHMVYQSSLAIAHGLADPMNAAPALPLSLRCRVLLADVRAWLQPHSGEELVILAQKPMPQANNSR